MPVPRRGESDACSFLDADHRKVRKMFKAYEDLTASRAPDALQQKLELAHGICVEVSVHAQIEDEIFYPALRAAIGDVDLLEEAKVEHASAMALVARIQDAEINGEFDALVTVLGEYVDHHVKEERSEIFARARAAHDLDLRAMKDRLEARKEELMSVFVVAAA